MNVHQKMSTVLFNSPSVLDGEHFLFGQFLKLSKLFQNFLSNIRIVKYGQELGQEKKLWAINQLIPNIGVQVSSLPKSNLCIVLLFHL